MFWAEDKRQRDCKRPVGHASPPMGPPGAMASLSCCTFLFFYSFLIVSTSAQSVATCTNGEQFLNVTTTKAFIETPGYGKEYYPPNMNCHFLLMAPAGYRILVDLEEVTMEPQLFDECLDYVSVAKDNLQLRADTIIKLCGAVNGRQVSSTDNQLTITFASDGIIQDKGARLSYQAIAPNHCDPGWAARAGSCLRLVEPSEGVDFIEAQMQCAQQQANLASISHETDYNDTMVWLNTATVDPWIGYTDAGSEGVIRGITERGATLWPIPQPPINGNEAAKDCIYLDLTGTHWVEGELPYRVADCRTKRSFICEKNKDGSTIPVPPPTERIKNGTRTANSDFTFLLLLFVILILILIGLLICYHTCLKRDIRVQPVTQEIHHHQQADGILPPQPTATQTRTVTQERSISPTVAAHQATTASPPNAVPRLSHQNNVGRALSPTAEPAPVVIHSIERAPTEGIEMVSVPPQSSVTVVNEVDTETAILPSRERTDVSLRPPEARPRQLPPLPLKEGTPYQTMNTREDSFMRARLAQEMFERPKMELLDNVSAISLDDFWSNKSKKH